MSSLTFKVISDPIAAKSLWEQFSPHLTVDDEWDFRNIWIESLDFPLYFIVGFDQDKPIGLLPLQLDKGMGIGPKVLGLTDEFLEFFGGVDTDNNKVYVLPGYEDTISSFLQEIKKPSILAPLETPYAVKDNVAKQYIDRYELDLTQFSNFEALLQKQFDGKSRQRLINRLNKLQKDYSIEIRDGSVEDLPILFQLSIDRFGENSSFNMEYRRQVFIKIAQTIPSDIFTILVNGTPKAVSHSMVYKGVYNTLNIGYDYSIRDISKLLVVSQLKRAIERECILFDAGKGDNGWKEHFHLKKIPQYKLSLNLPLAQTE